MKKATPFLAQPVLLTAIVRSMLPTLNLLVYISAAPGYDQYFKDFALAWKELGGIPHWHKQWTLLQDKGIDIFGYINNKYGEILSTFMNVCQQLKLDPQNLFINCTMEKVFQPTISPVV